MGAADISGIDKLFPQGQTAVVGAPAKTGDAKADFSQMMNRMTGWTQGRLASQNQQADPDSRRQTAGAVDSYDRYQYKENGIREKEMPADEADSVTPKLEKFAEDVKEVLKEELGVTDEQIEAAMETLGLTFIDLMDPAKLAGLAVELTESSEVSDLLCSDAFLTVMQEAGALGKELLEELGVTLEELTALVEAQKVPENPETEEKTFDEVLSAETEAVAVEPEHREVPEETGTVKAAVSGTETEAGRETQKTGERSEAEEPAEVKEQVTPVKEKAPEQGESGEKGSAPEQEKQNPIRMADHSRPAERGGDVVVGQHVGEVFSVPHAEAAAAMPEQVDVADIIRQIAEFTRVNAGNDATTLQMQLNPEHLGKLYLELTAREGNISARIMAQNETVKEALEAQIVELRQNMDDAGVKVDAIEVTIASHEFERNLEQNARQDERRAREQEKSAKRTRRIRLDDLEGLSGVMSEEESLVAQMMADQGNSVDFTA